MIADRVAFGHDTANDLRPGAYVATNEKEGCLGAILCQAIENSWRPRRIGPVIERQCRDTLCGFDTDYCL
jgi:hypothetical protein